MRDCHRIADTAPKGFLLTILLLILVPVVPRAEDDVSRTAPPGGEEPQAMTEEVEVVVDLDALEEVAPAGAPKSLIPDEPMLPVSITEMEISKQPMLKLAALALLVPVAAMLYRPKRKKQTPKVVVVPPSDDRKER